MKLQGRAALVTGAARGIGLAIASRFVAEGARVALVDIDRGVEDAAKRLGAQALGLTADVTATAEVERVVTSVHQRWGRLDVVVNNAGILRDRMVFNMSEEEWDIVIAVHLKGHFSTIKPAGVIFRQQQRHPAPDPPSRARHQRDLALKSVAHHLPPVTHSGSPTHGGEQRVSSNGQRRHADCQQRRSL